MMTFRHKLIKQTTKDIERLEKKDIHPLSWAGILVYGGTVGLLFVVPIIAGAYLGRWLDTLQTGYSVGWTINLILLGLGVGAYNVMRFFKQN